MLTAFRRPEAFIPGIVAIAGAAFLGMVDFAVPLDLDRRLGTTATAIGLLFALAAAMDAVGAPIAGRQGDRRGRLPVVVTGGLVIAASGAGLAIFGTLAGAALSLVVFGIGQAILFAGAVPWLDDAFGEFNRGLAYGGLNLVYATGYTVGPLVGGWLLESASADAAYLLMTGIAAAGAAILAVRGRALPR
jgi:MFS family permease